MRALLLGVLLWTGASGHARADEVLVFAPTVEDAPITPAGVFVPAASVRAPGRPEYRLSVAFTRAMRKKLEAFQPDLVHLATPDYLGVRALRWAKRRGVPVVASFHTHFASYLKYYHLGAIEPMLWAYGRWWQTADLAGEWRGASELNPNLEKARQALDKQFDPLDGKDAEGKDVFPAGAVPKIIVATQPTELLQSNGKPELTPIPGTQLLFVKNSRNDIFLQLGAQTYFVLISGRWFTAKSFEGPWTYVAGKSLPQDFSRIPASHPMADVMTSVPGTAQAKEAAIANQIPQTATVQRDVQPSPVQYDGGEPKWTPVEKTPQGRFASGKSLAPPFAPPTQDRP